LRCDQVFIIPSTDNEKARKVEPPRKEFGRPLPGFYSAVFKYSLPAIFNKQGLGTLIFILFVTSLKFFTIHLDLTLPLPGFTVLLPIGWIAAILIWGGLFWCYAEIVNSTAFDVEYLPEIYFGGGFGYIFSVLKSFYSFTIALIVVMLPAIIAKKILTVAGVQSNLIAYCFVVLGLFLFPMAVLIVSVSRDLLMLFRPDYFFTPIRKAFWHYLFLAGLFILTWQLQYISLNYGDVAGRPRLIILLHLLAVLAIQILAIVTMRATGLFYRHFAGYFKW
jgi:hypothetical protein